jgi:hypothetical protein
MPDFPTFLDLNFAPITHVATVTQSANAVSLGSIGSVAVASNVAQISQ